MSQSSPHPKRSGRTTTGASVPTQPPATPANPIGVTDHAPSPAEQVNNWDHSQPDMDVVIDGVLLEVSFHPTPDLVEVTLDLEPGALVAVIPADQLFELMTVLGEAQLRLHSLRSE